jgi:PKD repeat protein
MLINDFQMSASGTIYTTNFTVPLNVMPGEKRLRIRANWQNSAASPCSNFSYGETEDYTVVITGEMLIADFTADVTAFCQEGEVHFSDNSTGNVTTWAWEFPGGEPSASNEANPVVFYSTPGAYDVTLTVTGEQTNHTSHKPGFISVHQLPDVLFAEIPDQCDYYPPFELTQGSPAGGTYSGNGVMENWFYPEIAGLGVHELTYSYTDENGCENQAEQTVLVDVCTGIEEQESNFTIYPNPGKGVFMLVPNRNDQNTKITIFGSSGELVFELENISLKQGEPLQLIFPIYLREFTWLNLVKTKSRYTKLVVK